MNATMPIRLALKSIEVPHTNRHSIEEARLDELAATIREHTLLQPIVVRPHPTKKKSYELIAGERRLRAIERLGEKEIDACVIEASDDEAKEIRLVENLQRVDLTPWEEAEQLADLCEAGGRIEDIAVRLGRTPQWVAVRLAYSRLIPELKQHVIDQAWPLGHLPLLARVPREAQAEVLAEIRANQGLADEEANGQHYANYMDDWLDMEGNPVVPSLRVLEKFLEQRRRLLKKAKWKLDDAGLVPSAGACSACPKRSSAQYLLFPEIAEGQDDRCLDAHCWDRKTAALIQVTIDKLKEKGQKPILLKSHGKLEPAIEEAIGAAETKPILDYVPCKKNDPQATPAVIVGGQDAGKTEYVKPQPWAAQSAANEANGSNATTGKHERPVNQETGEREEPSAEERQAVIRRKRQCLAAQAWAGKLESFKLKFTGMLDALLVHFGTEETRRLRYDRDWQDFEKHKFKLGEDAWAQLCPVFQQRLRRLASMEQEADSLWLEARSQAKALGLLNILEFCWKDAVIDVPLTKTLVEQGIADQTEMPA